VDVEPVDTFRDLAAKRDFIARNFTAKEARACYMNVAATSPEAAHTRGSRWRTATLGAPGLMRCGGTVDCIHQRGERPGGVVCRALGRKGGGGQGHLLHARRR
jgi:hypothetical protein